MAIWLNRGTRLVTLRSIFMKCLGGKGHGAPTCICGVSNLFLVLSIDFPTLELL